MKKIAIACQGGGSQTAFTVGAAAVPDEIWVIQINPTRVPNVPTSTSEIIDRRNQMTGNVSLMQSIEFVEFCNLLLREHALAPEILAQFGFHRQEPIVVRYVRIADEVQAGLDYVSKLSRDPSHVQNLIDHGREQGVEFLRANSLAT